MRGLIVLLLSVFWLGLTNANSAIYYVDVSGSDATGDGSAARPWLTLGYAVTKVAANQNHIIRLSAGIFVEAGQVAVPLGVSIEGAGKDITILKAAPSFYYYPASPDYATDKILISLDEYNPSNGNQHLTGFTIDGDGKKLHGGILVRYRSNVTIDGVKVTHTNFTGIWLWEVKTSQLTNTDIINCSWGSTGYCSGALNLGNLDHVEIDHCYIDEDTGYGIKAIGPSGYNDILYTRIHDCTVTVNPFGLWNNGSAPNLAIELWMADPLYSEIYNCYIDNNVSLVNANNNPSTGNQTIRVHDNVIDLSTRAQGHGYGIELTMHDAEIDHNYFIKGEGGIANWDNPMMNWSIHHNVFYGIQSIYPVEIVRSQWSGLHNVKFYNNTIEFDSDKTTNVVGLYGGTSDNLDFRNNLVINSNTKYNYYPNEFIHLEGGSTISTLIVTNNLLYNLPIGTVPGTYASNLTSDPQIQKGTVRPTPYYLALAGSPLIDGGIDVGLPYTGSKPDIGAYEYGAATTTNIPPIVSVTSPANGSSFSNGTSITIAATATDSDGSISKVEFFNGTTKLGETLAAPYSFTIATATAGTYAITARATDNGAATTTSAVVTFVVTTPNQPPVVSITSPLNNSSFTAGTSITISATATDSDGSISKVEFFNGTTKLGEDLAAPYSFTIATATAGTYAITARATDNGAATTTSAVIAFVVTAPNQPPVVSISSPLNNSSFTAGTSITISATATDSDGSISKVEFFNGTTKLGEALAAPYSFTIATATAGTYAITARATDNSAATTTSAVITFVVTTPNQSPVVSITSPLNNSSFTAGTSITITATATDSDGSISKVEFFNGTTKLGETLAAPYSFTIATATAGTYAITARATDNSAATATSAVVTFVVTAPNQPPVVSISSPLNNSSFTAGTSITIAATATDSDGSISKVEFFNGTTKLGEALAAPYSFTIATATAGTYAITARATDNSAATTTSAVVTFVVTAPNQPPVVSITSPLNNSSFTAGTSITISATATDSDGSISKVEFFNGTTKLGEALAAPYSFTIATATAGTYAITARATDNSSATTTSSAINFTVTTPDQLPVVSITSPLDSSSVTTTSMTIVATATDSDGSVSKVEFFNGAVKMGETVSTPYSVVVSNLTAGNYSFTATATDNLGGVSTSDPVIVTITSPNLPPAVAITNPANNSSFFSSQSFTINVDASDPDGTVTLVEFFDGSTKIGETLTAPYSLTLSNQVVGTHIFTARATDDGNQSTISAPINVQIILRRFRPRIRITSPTNNSSFKVGTDVPIITDATDDDGQIVKVEFFSGSMKIGEDNAAPYQMSSTLLPEGQSTFSVTATDNDGLTNTDEVIVTAQETAAPVQIPRYFSPNEDGVNDFWDWGHKSSIQAQLAVFNGQGQKVFESQDYINEWDGKYNGRLLEEGPYYYIVHLAGEIFKGAVRIVRR